MRRRASLLVSAAFACVAAPAWASDGCTRFAREFDSQRVDIASLDANYLYQPLPESLRKLEAGHDPVCVVGGVADVLVACPVGDDLGLVRIIKDAPVIATDPEGFTVVIISRADNDKLVGQDLFWARCTPEATP